MYGYGYYGFDWTYLLLIIGMLLSLAASAKLKSTFARYKRVRSASGLTGEEAARRILYSAGITDVQVRPVAGSLTDHYDPRTKTVNLSQDIYGQTSLAAVGVAAHECGHAIQHSDQLCTAGDAERDRSGSKYRKQSFLAAVSDRTFCRHPPAGNSRYRAVFTGSSVSACDTSC